MYRSVTSAIETLNFADARIESAKVEAKIGYDAAERIVAMARAASAKRHLRTVIGEVP